VKRNWGFLLLAPMVFLITDQQTSAMQSSQLSTADTAQPQSQNQASSHDRHHHRHSNTKRHRRHHSSETKH
jgi:hypothetical protein